MLPNWCSDLRGCGLLLLLSLALALLGVPGCWPLTAALGVSCLAGLVFSICFFVHTTQTVFNRKAPFSPQTWFAHLMLTRPLEALWRFLTAPLRAVPDFQILGECRAGTTTLASHLREVGCVGPFSPWIVPLAIDKESFYFAGHYFGFVHPFFYRMCFPMKSTLWFRRRILGQTCPVFDACASHLTTPWTAPLMRLAAPDAALVVQVREPASQNLSWYSLEVGSVAWGTSMGMGEDWLAPGYPLRSLKEAVVHSRSSTVEALYAEGELLGHRLATSSYFTRLYSSRVPQKLLPHPGGQLNAFNRMGHYADNVKRYVDLFGLGRIVVIDLSVLAEVGGDKVATRRIAKLVPGMAQLQDQADAAEKARGELNTKTEATRLNKSTPLPEELKPPEEFMSELKAHYVADNRKFFDLIGQDLGWNTPAK